MKIAPAVNGAASAAENCDGGIVLNAGVTSYTYSGLSSGNKYGFRVCAYSGGTASAGVPIWADTE